MASGVHGLPESCPETCTAVLPFSSLSQQLLALSGVSVSFYHQNVVDLFARTIDHLTPLRFVALLSFVIVQI